MPSDTPDQRRRATEQHFPIGEVAGDAGHLADPRAEIARNPARIATARDAAREIDAALACDDRAAQSMFEDVDAILARVESGIADERAAMNALLDRLNNAA